MDAKIILGIIGCIFFAILAIVVLVLTIKEKDSGGIFYFIGCLVFIVLIGLATQEDIEKRSLEWTCCDTKIYSSYCPDCGKAKSDAWICCDNIVETDFCPDCGTENPQK